MAGDRKIAIHIKAVDEASKVLNNIARGSIPNFAKAIGGLAATYVSFSAVKNFVQAATRASAEAQVATVQLAVAIRNTGQAVGESLPKYEAAASRIQDIAGVDDDLIKQHGALLVSFGKLSADGFERASKAALDLGTATGNVDGAFLALAKAAGGNTTALQKMGIRVDANATSAQKFEQALTQIEARFGGSAAAKMQTYTGRLDEMKARWGNLLEKFGDLVTTSPAVLNALKGISDIIKDMTERLDTTEAQESLKGLVVSLLSLADAGILAARVSHALGGSIAALAQDIMKGGEDDKLFGNLRKFWMEDGKKVDAALQETAKQVEALREKIAGLSTTPVNVTANLPKSTGAPSPSPDNESEPNKTKKPSVGAPEMPEMAWVNTQLQSRLEDLGITLDRELTAKARLAEETMRALLESLSAGEITPERFEAVSKEVDAIVKSLREAGVQVKLFGDEIEATGATAEQMDSIREAAISLTAPVHDVADAWGKVLSAVQTVADAMPDAAKVGAGGVNELIQRLNIAAQRAVEAQAEGGAAAIQASVDAAMALSDVLVEITYLTPEQREQLAEALKGVLDIGAAAEKTSEKQKKLSEEQKIAMDVVTRAATTLGDLMVDAAFGAKVAWRDAIRALIVDIAKAIVRALILKAINKAARAASGGFSLVSINMSKGGIVPEYAATGAIFKPRGTDTVPAMLTPGEIVIDRKTAQQLLRGQVAIKAGRSATGQDRKIIGGRLAVSPSGIGVAYAASGFVVPGYASDVERPFYSLSRAGRGGSSDDSTSPVTTRTHVPINLGGARLADLLITNSDGVIEVLDYIDARRR